MPETSADELSSSLYRTIFGILLVITGVLGVGMTRQLLGANIVTSIIGVAIIVIVIFLLVGLFLEGIREGSE